MLWLLLGVYSSSKSTVENNGAIYNNEYKEPEERDIERTSIILKYLVFLLNILSFGECTRVQTKSQINEKLPSCCR
jgi:hypothetical protein